MIKSSYLEIRSRVRCFHGKSVRNPQPPPHSSQKRLHTSIFVLGINVLKITYHVFVGDSENYMDKRFGNNFLENLISVT